MGKILFIDDEKERLDNLKKRCAKTDRIKFSCSIYDFFEPVDSGKSVNKKYNEDFDYFFFHNSINEPKIPETFLNAIKNKVGKSKVFCFSGGSADSPGIYRFKRNTIYDNFIRFIEFSIKNNEWYILAIHDNDYCKKYAKKLLEDVRKIGITTDLQENPSYQKLVQHLKIKSDAYKKFDSFNSFIAAITDKIESR